MERLERRRLRRGNEGTEFLNELSQMIGDYDRRTTSTSVGRGSRSTSHGIQRDRTLDVADLGALPRGRAVVFASGAPATLVETVPWMNGPHAEKLRTSIAAHDPSHAGVAHAPTPAADGWIVIQPSRGQPDSE